MARILTTVVGSYPLPDWLAALPSEQALADAMRVVIHTQEQAGLDLVCDGELYRFDVNHPQTNGMIEYFVRPMAGVRPEIGFSDGSTTRKGAATRFRSQPAGRGRGPDRRRARSTCRRLRARPRPRAEALQVHAHRPAHAGEDAARPALQGPGEAGARHRRRARRPGEAPRRRRDPGRRSQPSRPPRRMEVGRGGDQQGPRGRAEESQGGGAPVLRQLRRPVDPEGHLGQADGLPQRASRSTTS